MKSCGIYKIICGNRYYYGSSQNIQKRWMRHKCNLRHNNHSNATLQNVWNKYGESAVSIEIVKEVPKEQLLITEQAYLDEHVGHPRCMNVAANSTSPSKGRIGEWKQSAESNNKRAVAARLQWATRRDEMVAATSKHNKSRPARIRSDEERIKRNKAIAAAWTPSRREQMRRLAVARNKTKGHF